MKKMNSVYSKKVIQFFKHPKNMGEIKNADAIGIVGNPLCGDVMKLYLKIDKKSSKIKNIKFQTMGCIAAIATSSMVTTLAKGKTLKQAKKITNKQVVSSLGKLPQVKLHCSNLAEHALKKAIGNWENTNDNNKKNKK
jgi:nitrogen fixation NifU-like protein